MTASSTIYRPVCRGFARVLVAAVALCVAALSGSVIGVASRRRSIAFGPHLVVASVIVLVAHEPTLEWVFDSGGLP